MTTSTNSLRLHAARLSVPDELHWYNNNTNWHALSHKEFRSIMIRMESITAQHYEDFGTGRSNRSAAIKAFWADEWGCEYQPESGKWLNLTTGAFIESETEKKAKRDAKKAARKEKKEQKAKQTAQYNDEEEEVYVQAAQKQQQQQEQQQQLYDDWFDAEEEAYAEAYAQARAQEEQQAQAQQAQAQQAQAQQAQAQQAQAQQAQAQQAQAQAYLDSYTSEEDQEEQEQERIACQAVLYLEELTDVQGDPDWRAYIYYDERIRRYVLKGTRRSLRATSRKTVYPEVKLCFRSSRELASFLCSSTETLNVSMFAMTGATVRDATFAELYALPARGCKTELFGYDQTRPRYSTFVNYLRIVRDMDASHSTFAAF
jgi:hypothetical protein